MYPINEISLFIYIKTTTAMIYIPDTDNKIQKIDRFTNIAWHA